MEFLSALLSFIVAAGTALSLFVGNIVTTYTEGDVVVSIVEPPAQSTASSTLPIPTPETTPASSTPPEKPAAAATPLPTPAVPKTPPVPEAAAPEASGLDSATLNAKARDALVNILCLSSGGGVRPGSGSGVFVDKRGVILTNAHVGQLFLLKDYPTRNDVNCVVRTGSPAMSAYRARLIYLPPAWIKENADQIDSSQAKGTGEDDYAFLLVTEAVDSDTPLPEDFPALPMTLGEPHINDTALLAAYPAGFLDGISIQKNLYATTAYAAVKELFTFSDRQTVDLVSIGGTVVSQGGSSGGAGIRIEDGRLQGIIATATEADTTAGRDLRMITLGHINRSLAAYGKGGIKELLSQDLAQAADEFESDTAPQERAALIKALK